MQNYVAGAEFCYQDDGSQNSPPRWEHDELGPLNPDRFIPVAEQSGLIVGIGRWILEHACAEVAAAHRFPINLIKIDQLFIRTLDDGTDSSLVRAILAMADSLGLASVAEGIETATQMEVLVRFARPSSMEALVATWPAITGTHDGAMVSG